MRIIRLGVVGEEIPVLRTDGTDYDLRSITSDIDGAFLSRGGLREVPAALAAKELRPLEGWTSARIGAPIARPGKVVCIGLNYRDHAEETESAIPAEPVVFLKDPTTVIGPFDDVMIPRGSSKTDWEVELGVIIGTTARYLASPQEALSHVAGYAISHDVSEREFQLERGGQWDKGKSCETFNPLGPYLVTPDEIHNPQQLGLGLRVNGEQRQSSTTANMIFPVDHVIWYLSQFMVLHPGDLINTGTPAGVALGLPGHPYLRAGDTVELEIDRLGLSRQTLVQA